MSRTQRRRFESKRLPDTFFNSVHLALYINLIPYAFYESSTKVNRWPKHTRKLRGKATHLVEVIKKSENSRNQNQIHPRDDRRNFVQI